MCLFCVQGLNVEDGRLIMHGHIEEFILTIYDMPKISTHTKNPGPLKVLITLNRYVYVLYMYTLYTCAKLLNYYIFFFP